MDIDKIPKTVRTPELEKELAGKSFELCQNCACDGKPEGERCKRTDRGAGWRFIGACKIGKTKLGRRVCIKIDNG